MSMKRSFYVGPYIQAFFRMIEKNTLVRGCEECDEENYREDNKYCSICGSPIKEYHKKETIKSMSWWEIEEIEDLLVGTGEITHQGFDILLPNNRYNEREFFLDESQKLQEIQGYYVSHEIVWLKNKYKKEIKILKNKYDHIDIKWGVVQIYD